MEELFASLGNWTWWIVAGILFVLELLAPGGFFMWLGLAAICVGCLVLVVELPWQGEIAAFAVLSVISLVISRYYFAGRQFASDRPHLNNRMMTYVGQRHVLDKPIVNGRGQLRLDDTLWEINGKDVEAGEWVRITGVEGSTFLVEPSPGTS